MAWICVAPIVVKWIPEVRRLPAVGELEAKTEELWLELPGPAWSVVHDKGLMQRVQLLARAHGAGELKPGRERRRAQQRDGDVVGAREQQIQRYGDPDFIAGWEPSHTGWWNGSSGSGGGGGSKKLKEEFSLRRACGEARSSLLR